MSYDTTIEIRAFEEYHVMRHRLRHRLTDFGNRPSSDQVAVITEQRGVAQHTSNFYEQMSVTARTGLAAGTAAGISSGLGNPLDCLKVRWQVLPTNSYLTQKGLIQFGADIIRKEGLIEGLWKPGLSANMMGMGLSAAIRFGHYEMVRDALVRLTTTQTPHNHNTKMHNRSTINVNNDDLLHSSGTTKSGYHMLGAGILVGSVGYMVTTPFHLIKTRIQADRAAAMTSQHAGKKLSVYTTADLTTSFARILKEEGFASLFKGMGPLTCRGALFTSGQMMGYDGFKTLAKTYYDIRDGPYLHLCASVAASFGASFLSAPADLIMAHYMVSGQNSTVTSCIQSVYRQNGLLGFWRGWSLFFVRLTPILFTFTTVYEQLRFQLGLGYMS